MSPRAMLLGAACAASILAPAVAAAAGAPTYPPSLERAAILSWLTQATDLKPEQVVGNNDASLYAIVDQSGPPSHRRIALRVELLTPAATAGSGVLAIDSPVELDCVRGLLRVGESIGYNQRTPGGRRTVVAPPALDWRKPQAGTPFDGVLQVGCAAASAPGAAAPPPASGPPAATTAARPAPGGRLRAIQVTSATDAASATAAAERQRAPLAAAFPGLTSRVETAKVGGRSVYRGLIVGFGSRSDAEAACDRVRRSGQGCLLR